MLKRESINIRGVDKTDSHGPQPIPMGSKVGNIVYSSPIPPTDPDTGTVPPDAQAQAVVLFKNIQAFVEASGGSTENIVYISFSINDINYRDYLNPEWVKMFPDEKSRPARRMLIQGRPRDPNRVGGTHCHADVVLVVP